MVYAIIAAGGIGTRFGAGKPKQLVEIDGESILRKTAGVFESIERISKTVVACPPDWICECKEQLSDMEKVCVISGGDTRNDTVMRALEYIADNFGIDSSTIVVTHDAVRPFVTEKIITDSIEKAEIYGAAVAAVSAVDTIIECENGFVKNVPVRERMYHVQTPQTFSAQKLLHLYSKLSESEKSQMTDCSAIFVKFNEPVAIVEGDRANKKITYRDDVK